MDVRYLGPLSIERNGTDVALGGPKPQVVLAHLAVHARTLVSTDTLIDALWPDAPPSTARNTLQTYVSHLRRSIGSDRIESQGAGYILHVEPAEVDASRFGAQGGLEPLVGGDAVGECGRQRTQDDRADQCGPECRAEVLRRELESAGLTPGGVVDGGLHHVAQL